MKRRTLPKWELNNMAQSKTARRAFLQSVGISTMMAAGALLLGQEREEAALPAASHPLDPALKVARETLDYLRKDIADYECQLFKKERVGEELRPPERMFVRVRNRKEEDGKVTRPLSVYLRFLEPKGVQGQEVLWVEGKNDDKLLARPGGLGGVVPALRLDPQGPLAMRGNRYPISEIGIENLVNKLIEKGERDRKHEECAVDFKAATINKRPCQLVEVTHPTRRPHFDFHIARIYIDDELKLPVRYQALSWPAEGTKEPVLLEEYTYVDVKVNVGLTDDHFDEWNKEYKFH